jgi:hypothetical protein
MTIDSSTSTREIGNQTKLNLLNILKQVRKPHGPSFPSINKGEVREEYL